MADITVTCEDAVSITSGFSPGLSDNPSGDDAIVMFGQCDPGLVSNKSFDESVHLIPISAIDEVQSKHVADSVMLIPIGDVATASFTLDELSKYVYIQGETIVLSGSGVSSGASLMAEEMYWASDIDGIIGRGFSISWKPRSIGEHVVTVFSPLYFGETTCNVTIVANDLSSRIEEVDEST